MLGSNNVALVESFNVEEGVGGPAILLLIVFDCESSLSSPAGSLPPLLSHGSTWSNKLPCPAGWVSCRSDELGNPRADHSILDKTYQDLCSLRRSHAYYWVLAVQKLHELTRQDLWNSRVSLSGNPASMVRLKAMCHWHSVRRRTLRSSSIVGKEVGLRRSELVGVSPIGHFLVYNLVQMLGRHLR